MSTLGWIIGVSRPHGVVYAALAKTRRELFGIAGAAILLALVVSVLGARAVSKPVIALAGEAAKIGQRQFRELRSPTRRSDELGDLERAISGMAADLKAQEQAIVREAKQRTDLSRFMAPQLVDAIVRGDHPLELGGQRREITVLFADVVAFTPLAEKRAPEEAVEILNELFTLLSEVVFRHGGLVDKFVGDCLMAIWGATGPSDDHADRALAAAEDMLQFLEPAAQIWRARYGAEIRLGIGVASGAAIVGNVGSKKRMEYTAIGDTVNVASRLEAMARPNQILVSGETKARASSKFSFRDLGAHKLHGRSAETPVFELET